MALRIVELQREVLGRLRVVIAEITFDSTYPQDGEIIRAMDFGLADILYVAAMSHAHDSAGYLGMPVRYNPVTGALQLIRGDGGNGPFDASMLSVRLLIWGR